MFNWNKKEKPSPSFGGFGGGGLGIAGGVAQVGSASGGNVNGTSADGSKYHIFTSPGNFVVSGAGGDVSILAIAGGGGGGIQHGGGGGAGALYFNETLGLSDEQHIPSLLVVVDKVVQQIVITP